MAKIIIVLVIKEHCTITLTACAVQADSNYVVQITENKVVTRRMLGYSFNMCLHAHEYVFKKIFMNLVDIKTVQSLYNHCMWYSFQMYNYLLMCFLPTKHVL